MIPSIKIFGREKKDKNSGIARVSTDSEDQQNSFLALITTGVPFKGVRNKGEFDQYYMKYANPAIVSDELFDTANRLLKQQGR